MSRTFVRFLLVLALLCAVIALGHAIYDPREATTKPPKRRESALPWYLTDKADEDLSRAAKWDRDNPGSRKPYVVDVDTKSWSPWRKKEGSEIEQRTEVTGRESNANFDRPDGSSLEYSQYEQRDDQEFPFASDRFIGQQDQTKVVASKRKDSRGNALQRDEKDDQDYYEGISADSPKPRKEKILVSTKAKSTVARYDSEHGVQCPEFDSTGQFVYPPDCKFFVNCWKGRAFVQPCAPGTLFNQDTLECDFPHKVKCYGGEVVDFPSDEQLDSSGRREPLLPGNHGAHFENGRQQEPRCPRHVTGLLPHPSDCTKFLQCANGGTIVMDCGPGTVFNPVVSVCDWPNNVRGCEDAVKSKEETTSPQIPADYEDYEHVRSEFTEHRESKKVTCPADYTGLLPHPETCTKFLQCTNGGTFVMDCGPGTAFNPSISVCDWPYNVPSCKKDKKEHEQSSGSATTIRSWSPHGSTDSWQSTRHGHGQNYPSKYPEGHSTTASPLATNWGSMGPSRPRESFATTKPSRADWDPSKPTWKPTWRPGTWTTPVPAYPRTEEEASLSEQHRYNGHGNWDQGQGTTYPQWPHRHATSEQSPSPNDEYYHHYHHHVHGQTYDPKKNTETQQPAPDHVHPGPEAPAESIPQPGTWNSNDRHHHVHHHYHHYHGAQDETRIDQQGQEEGHGGFDGNGRPPDPGSRIDQEHVANRREHGRTGFAHPGYGQAPVSGHNIYVDNTYRLPANGESKTGALNKTTWTQTVLTQNRSAPNSWSQLGQQPPRSRQWNEGATYGDEKFHAGRTGTGIYQSTADREADAKFDGWASKTNIFQNGKGQQQAGIKNGNGNRNPSLPSSVYVNVNGTRGHFVTKEIGTDRGHSQTRTYKPNAIQGSNKSNESDTNVYIDSQTANSQHVPSLVLQPPLDAADTSLFDSTNSTRSKNHTLYGRGYRTKKYYWSNDSSPGTSVDLAGSGSTHGRVPVPPTNLRPPYPSAKEASIPGFWTNFSQDSYYPAVPAIASKPPADTKLKFPIGWQYSPDPAPEPEPAYFTPPTRSLDRSNVTSPTGNRRQKAATTFQPSSQLAPPNVPKDNRRANVSTSAIDSSRRGTNNRTDPDSHRTAVKIIPEAEVTLSRKKKVSEATESPAIRDADTLDRNVPAVWIDEESPSMSEFPDILEPDFERDVDVLVEKEVWKPVLVFENKTQTTTESSVIMKIDKKNVKKNVDLLNIEETAAKPEDEVPPFPAYYVPSVAPINHSNKLVMPTPISGQVIRLRGGSGPHDGYVEVQGTNPGWGIVCDTRNNWTLKEAHVVCKQLGYARGAEMAWQGRNNHENMPTWIAANSVLCQGNEARFQSCKFTHEQECRVERDAIGVRCVLNRVAQCRKDEIPHEGQCYHLADPESGFNHAEALDYCSNRRSRLVDITSQAENDFISEWMLQMHPDVTSIMTSGVGFTTMNRTLWLWEDSSRAKFRFAKWWPGWMEDKKHPPYVGSRPLCIVAKRTFPCHERPDSICVADYFFWDTEDCASSGKGHSYICKRPYDDIGCIYGKGSQYAGTANVTASGRDCLSWGDPIVAHPLVVNVLNREVREKLRSHNYCRNPNPNRESRPWCFTGPRGQREYCDIPPCGNMGSPKSLLTGQCKPKHFECLPGECIPAPWVCDGDEDCTNGADERACVSHMDLFQKHSRQKLEGYDVQKWLNTPLKTCALRCKEAEFTCRSFSHNAAENICLLSDSNIGMTGSLKTAKQYDYYEMIERSINCDGMFVCNNRKCINQTQVCNGKNDCNDRSDENICTVENLDYDIRLAGAEDSHEGRIEVKILGVWGQVCDDGFGMIDAEVICKELGFKLGALEVRPGGFYGNMDPPTRFLVDQLRCHGNETSLRECDFEGWGVHNCQPEEAVGVVCKTAVDICQDGHWKCDKSRMCIPTAFICDEVVDCPDGSDESSVHCDAPFEIRLANGSSPLEGRVEVRHHGIWGTVCDDDFSNATATVICRSLGYGGRAVAKKDGFFGPGEGPIWLDEVACFGNETQLYRCDHNHWGQHNCNHDEDAGVICTHGDINDSKPYWENEPRLLHMDINDILPANCGRRFKDFNEDEDLIFEKVVRGSVAPKGAYPWQASIRVRGHSRSNHWCGAVILSPLHVLTAAHCLQGYNKGTYFVRAGDYHTEINEGTEADANIEDYYIHEDFRKGHRMNNDIALVLLKGRGIPLGKDIMPICLPPENTEYPPGLNCTISGFGSIETGKSAHSKDLRYGWIPLLDQSVCRAGHVYGDGAISDGMVCAGYLDEGVDTCDGDSGGPLACLHNGAFTLYGITSWGQHCGRANKPGVYVRVSHYRQWIDRKIKESLSGR